MISTLRSPPNQITGNRLTDRICGNQVAVEHAPELNRRHLVDPATVALADIVDEHIDVSKRGNCQPRRVLLRNIKRRAMNIQSLSTKLMDGCLEYDGLASV